MVGLCLTKWQMLIAGCELGKTGDFISTFSETEQPAYHRVVGSSCKPRETGTLMKSNLDLGIYI